MSSKQPINYEGYQGLAQALFEESDEAQFLFDPKSKLILDVMLPPRGCVASECVTCSIPP
jgi:hypothetical protein